MAEDAEDHEIFDITDFTTASDWERFIVRIEEVINEWKLINSSENDKQTLNFVNGVWREKADTIQFYDVSFTITRYYLEESTKNVKNNEHLESNKVSKSTIDNENDENKESQSIPPLTMANLLYEMNDFKQNAPILAYWYGLTDYIVISTTRHNDAVDTETKLNALLSSVSIAINNTGCVVPIFIQIGSNNRNMFVGVCEGSGLRTHFQTVHFNSIPFQYAYLSGLLEIFKSKLGPHLIDPTPLIFVSIRFTYLIGNCLINSLNEIDKKELDIDFESSESADVNIKDLPFGSKTDPIDCIYLACVWPSLSEDMLIERETYTDLNPLQSQEWSITLCTNDDLELKLTQVLQKFYDQTKKTISVTQIVSASYSDGNITSSTDDYKQSLQKLTGSNILDKHSRSIHDFMKPVVEKANKIKQFNKISYDLPIDKQDIQVLVNFLFPDANGKDSESDENWYKELYKLKETNELLSKLIDKLKNIKSSGSLNTHNKTAATYNSSANNNCLLNRLVLCMAICNYFGGAKAIAQLWYEFVFELRYRWEKNHLICGIQTGTPDLSRSLLHQKLQMLNCCISKKLERDKLVKSDNDTSVDEDNDEFFDCIESSSENTEQPDGRLKPYGDLMLLNKPEPLYVPITQESTPMTEDMLDEHASVLVNLGSTEDSALLRAKIQSASLLSDMEAFKAANPGCVLEDFVRWYSPRDWVETETLNTETKVLEKKYDLSNRMKIPGNVWIEAWQSAKAVPVRKQKRLFDDTKEAEKVFEWLNSLNIGQIVEQLLPILFHVSILTILDEGKEVVEHIKHAVDTLVDKTCKISCNNEELKKYQELINTVKFIEILLSRYKSLKQKFVIDENDDCTKEELNEFLGALLKSTTVNSQEVKVRNGANSNLGRVIVKLFKKCASTIVSSVGDEPNRQTTNDPVDIFNKPYRREYILRSSAPRPAPYSRPSPQRMYCLLSNNEFRLAGAFTEDTTFF